MKAIFHLRGEDSVEVELGPLPVSQFQWHKLSLAYCCPQCGIIWAKIELPGHRWHFRQVDCEGSVLLDPMIALDFCLEAWMVKVSTLPESWLRRELEILLKGEGDAN